jgi:hypothetical protein
MNLNDHDFDAEQGCLMATDWLGEEKKEIDTLFGAGYAKKNLLLLGDFLQAAATKYHVALLSKSVAAHLDNLTAYS